MNLWLGICQKFVADCSNYKTHVLYNLQLSWATELSTNSLGQQPYQVNMSTNQEAGLHSLALTGSWPTMTHRFGKVYIHNTDWHLRYSVSLIIRADGSRNNVLLTVQPPNAAASLRKFYWIHMSPLFAFLPNWHVKKKSVAETWQMALIPWPLATAHIFFHNHPYVFYFQTKYQFFFSDGSSPLCIYNKSNEMQEDSRIHNKPLYWIKYATKTTCFGPLLWGHLQV